MIDRNLLCERSVARVEVTDDGRHVEALVMPWMTPIEVTDRIGEEFVTYREQFARGAFAGAEARPDVVALTWGHSELFGNDLGRGVRFAATDEGELGLFRLNEHDAPKAREVLEGIGMSIRFHPQHPKGTEAPGVLVTRERVHVHHVAAVRNPAYADARVLAIRAADDAARLDAADKARTEAEWVLNIRWMLERDLTVPADHLAEYERLVRSGGPSTPPAA